MSDVSDVLGQLPIDEIARRLGVDTDTARQATELAVPALLHGLHANAQDPAGAGALSGAIGQHGSGLFDGLASGRTGIDEVDEADGEKIVGHVFGGQGPEVAATLGGLPGPQSSALMRKALAILAPIVLSYLAKKFLGGASGAAAGTTGGSAGGLGGGGLADILGSILGAGSPAAASGSGRSPGAAAGAGGIDLGSILGSILAGGAKR